jgi:CHAD domain-containing protein
MRKGSSSMSSRNRSVKAGPKTMIDRLAGWRLLLERCARKPVRKNVHALRVLTLRVQAELEQDLNEQWGDSEKGIAIARFRRQAAKLRRALGPVRELDVWLDALSGLRASLTEAGSYVPRSTSEAVFGIERLEVRLKRKRRGAGKKLVQEIEQRKGQLVSASENVEAAMGSSVLGHRPALGEEIAARFKAISKELPKLDAENLHDFRKRIKVVRYLAEMHGDVDPICTEIGVQMKKMQGAIGAWHDWQALAREVRDGGRAKDEPLAELLDTLTAESFDAVIATVESIRSRLNSKPEDQAERTLRISRKPPSFDRIGSSILKNKLA